MKELITYEDFTKVDIRIGTITDVQDFPKAHKAAYQIQIDFGTLGTKKTSAQITTLYTKKELLGKQVTAIINFKPKQIADFLSECLILGIQKGENVILLKSNDTIKNGEQIN